jgi:hypothetical protein
VKKKEQQQPRRLGGNDADDAATASADIKQQLTELERQHSVYTVLNAGLDVLGYPPLWVRSAGEVQRIRDWLSQGA